MEITDEKEIKAVYRQRAESWFTDKYLVIYISLILIFIIAFVVTAKMVDIHGWPEYIPIVLVGIVLIIALTLPAISEYRYYKTYRKQYFSEIRSSQLLQEK